MPVAFGIGIISSLCTIPFVPKLKNFVEKKFTNENNEIEDINIEMTEQSKTYNITNEKELNRIVNLHENAEKFDEKTEYTFRYLQIFTAICDAFSLGANDVANAIGPFAAMWAIHNSTDLSKKSDMESDAYWILGLGGAGIALGLFLYGYRITHAIGTKLVKITPSRGVAIELASAFVIITGSRLKIPLSTTHCQVGATVGVGALEDPKGCGGINCKIFSKTALGWIVTCLIVGLTAGLLTAQGVYAPTVWNHCPLNQTV